MNDRKMKLDELEPCELTIDELDVVGGGSLLDSIVEPILTVYRFCTGTITSHATTLP
jgi:hypothetical protein